MHQHSQLRKPNSRKIHRVSCAKKKEAFDLFKIIFAVAKMYSVVIVSDNHDRETNVKYTSPSNKPAWPNNNASI